MVYACLIVFITKLLGGVFLGGGEGVGVWHCESMSTLYMRFVLDVPSSQVGLDALNGE